MPQPKSGRITRSPGDVLRIIQIDWLMPSSGSGAILTWPSPSSMTGKFQPRPRKPSLISRSSAGPPIVPPAGPPPSLPARAASPRARSRPPPPPVRPSSLRPDRLRRSPLALRALALAHVPLLRRSPDQHGAGRDQDRAARQVGRVVAGKGLVTGASGGLVVDHHRLAALLDGGL